MANVGTLHCVELVSLSHLRMNLMPSARWGSLRSHPPSPSGSGLRRRRNVVEEAFERALPLRFGATGHEQRAMPACEQRLTSGGAKLETRRAA